MTPRQSNVLVDGSGRAQITDFGLAVVSQDPDLIRSGLDEYGDSVRWIAPEILDGRGTYSKEGDAFSFAMVMVEVRCIQPTWRLPNVVYPNEGFHRCYTV